MQRGVSQVLIILVLVPLMPCMPDMSGALATIDNRKIFG
jgi:hypothetical protein